MVRYISLLLCFALLAGCNTTSDPVNPPGSSANELAMTQLTDLPMDGGNATGIAFLNATTLVAAIDGKLYTLPALGGAPTLMHSDANYIRVVAGPSGEIYAQTTEDLRVIDQIGGTPKVTPVQVKSSFIEKTILTVSPTGEPFMLVFSYPAALTVYHSTDKGATWPTLTLPNGYRYGGGITFGPSGEIMLTSPEGFYKTSDRGATWSTFPAPQVNYGGDLLLASNGDIYHYVSGGGGLRVSKNGGASFTELSQFNRSPYFITMLQGDDGALYALANRSTAGTSTATRPMSLLRSGDGGATWQTLLYVQGHDLAMRGSVMAVGGVTNGGGLPGGVVISQNYGGTWALSGMKPVSAVQDFGFDKAGNLMILADLTLFRKTAAGWQMEGSGMFSRFATTPQGNLLGAHTGGTFYSSDDGNSWVESTEYPGHVYGGIGAIRVPVVLGKKDGEFLVSVTTYRDDTYPQTHTNGGLYKIGADGKPKRITGANGNFVKIIEDKSGVLYAGTVNFSDALKSTDGGNTWEKQATGTPAVAINSNNKYLKYGESGTYRLGQLGSDETSELKLPGFTSAGNYVTSIMFDRNDRLYILTMDKGLFSSMASLK